MSRRTTPMTDAEIAARNARNARPVAPAGDMLTAIKTLLENSQSSHAAGHRALAAKIAR